MTIRVVRKFIAAFRDNKIGAVTVDWVVLSAAVIIVAYTAVGYVNNGAKTIQSTLATGVSNADEAALGQ